MENIKIIKLLILSVIVFIVIGFFGFYFFKEDSGPLLKSAVTGGSPESQQILNALNELKNIKLDGQIFTDPVFQGLEDFTRQVNEEPKQRPNPFAPISPSNPNSGVFTPPPAIRLPIE